MRTWRSAALLAAALATPAVAVEPAWREEAPRAFGYVLGDRVTRRVSVDAPAPLRLDEASLPRPARTGRYLELQQLRRDTTPLADGTRYRLELVYQVIGVADAIRSAELPALSLRLRAGDTTQTVDIPAQTVTVGPVAPATAFDDMLDDAPAPPMDVSAARRQTLAGAALAALLAAAWAVRRYLLPWLRPSARPFHRAWRQLRRLRRAGAGADAGLGQALSAVHGAFNQTFGETLLPEALPAFLRAHPAYQGLDAEITEFFARSHGHLFGGRPFAPAGRGWPQLIDLCRRLRAAERRR